MNVDLASQTEFNDAEGLRNFLLVHRFVHNQTAAALSVKYGVPDAAVATVSPAERSRRLLTLTRRDLRRLADGARSESERLRSGEVPAVHHSEHGGGRRLAGNAERDDGVSGGHDGGLREAVYELRQ